MRSPLAYGTHSTTLWYARTRTGFSLVELLVALSIIATLSIVAYASIGNIQKNQLNARRVSDITALGNAIETMVLETKALPFPTANRAYYSSNGAYTHSSSGAFGVTSSLSEDILGKYALSEHPRDPETGVYYRYGLTLTQTGSTLRPSYQIAGVLRDGTSATALVRGTYIATPAIPSLIKGYNSTSFVVDGGTDTLPYNPTERSVTANIVSASGAVSINPTKSLTSLLVLGDELTVGTGGLASIKISDGTEISLGSPTNVSVLKINELQVKDDRGLFTRVRLILSSGQVGARVPELRVRDGNRSDLEIESGGAVAAVRGTIFGVNAGDGAPGTPRYITLIAGSLETQRTDWASLIVTGRDTPTGTNNTIVVPEGSPAQTITVWGYPNIPTLTPTTTSLQMVQVSALQSQIKYAEWLKVPTDPEIIGVAFTGAVEWAVPLKWWVRFRNPHAGRVVRVEGASNTSDIAEYTTLRPLYKKLDGSIPDILDVTGLVNGDPVIWQADFVVNSGASGAIKISICNRRDAPKTCSPSQSFTLPRVPEHRTSIGGKQIFQKVATGTGEFASMTFKLACTLSDSKFCDKPDLIAYADMNQNGKLILRDGRVITNAYGNGTTEFPCAEGRIVDGAWLGCISYNGAYYTSLLGESKRIEIVYNEIPSSTALGSLFQMKNWSDVQMNGDLFINKFIRSSIPPDISGFKTQLWTNVLVHSFPYTIINYSITDNSLKMVISASDNSPSLIHLGDKINIGVKETYNSERGYNKPIKNIWFYK